MNGVQIEYALGILAIILSTTWVDNIIKIDKFRLGFGIFLIVVAFLGYTIVR